MIILLHGPDTFRSQKKRDELLAAYRAKYAGGLSESFFSDENFSLRDFEEHMRGQGLFSGKRLLVLKNISYDSNALRSLEASIKKSGLAASRDVFVVVWEDRDMQKIKEAAFLLKITSPVQLFSKLEGGAYRAWLTHTAGETGISFARDAHILFSQWHEGDTWASVADMEKLHAYTRGTTIQSAHVELLCKKPSALSIFTTLDLMFNKKSVEAFAALENHVQNGEEPLYLLKMIEYQLRLIALVKEKMEATHASAAIPGVHPYAARKVMPIARNLSWEKLNKLFTTAYQSDAAIKQGTADPALCLEMFAYEIVRA